MNTHYKFKMPLYFIVVNVTQAMIHPSKDKKNRFAIAGRQHATRSDVRIKINSCKRELYSQEYLVPLSLDNKD